MLILASSSPRRAWLLTMLGLTFSVVRPDCDETPPPGCPPGEVARRLAARKAQAVAAQCDSRDSVIAADTLVCLEGRTMGKPRDAADACEMLNALSGCAHEVYTGLAVHQDGVTRTESQMTRVFFRPLRDREIRDYIQSGAPMDKAGAYGIQDRGALFVRRIEGDFYNVMGLPLCLLSQMLEI